MTDPRPGILGEIAIEAGIERASFVNDAADQLQRFLEAQQGAHQRSSAAWCCSTRTRTTCPSRRTSRSAPGRGSRTPRPASGARRPRSSRAPRSSSSCTTRRELYAWFAEAAREQAGLPDEPTGAQDLLDVAGIAAEEASASASAAATRTSGRPTTGPPARTTRPPADASEAARRLYDLALTFQERSQLSEARLIEQFEIAAAPLAGALGDLLHPRRRGRAAVVQGQRRVRGGGHPRARRGGRGRRASGWPLQSPRGHGPVLRPDRPVRRPRRDARRAVPGGRSGVRGRGRRGGLTRPDPPSRSDRPDPTRR